MRRTVYTNRLTEKKASYGPLSCCPMIPDPVPYHRAEIPPDDNGPITFAWHFQKGMLKPRMSALELAEFVLHHMPSIIGLLSGHPRIMQEFHLIMTVIQTGQQDFAKTLPLIIEEDRNHCWPNKPRTSSVENWKDITNVSWLGEGQVQIQFIGYEAGRVGRVIKDNHIVAHLFADKDSQPMKNRRFVLDRLLPWIRSVCRDGPDDIIHMSLFDKTEQPKGPVYYL